MLRAVMNGWALVVLFILLFCSFFQSLRDKQKTVRESQGPNMKQMKMWSVSSANPLPRIHKLALVSGNALLDILKAVFLLSLYYIVLIYSAHSLSVNSLSPLQAFEDGHLK